MRSSIHFLRAIGSDGPSSSMDAALAASSAFFFSFAAYRKGGG